MSKRVVLIILDGWGIGHDDDSNPIYVVKPKNINYLKANFPAGALQASGINVGLPWNEEGNSEVGHLNIGAGKIIYQHYPAITLAVRQGDFFKNEAIKGVFEHAKKNQSAVNMVGLLSEGNIHASLEHLKALIEFAAREGVSNFNLHLFTDGRDSAPFSASKLLADLPQEKIASLSGRFYAMDRDRKWERTRKTYDVLTGGGPLINDIKTHIQKTYDQKFNDEFVEPVLIGPENRGIKENDAIIFFNFREDRMRQIAAPFVEKNFSRFPTKPFKNIYVATMTRYEDSFGNPAAFQRGKTENSLSRVLSDSGKTQMKIAETQKYPHITYFFNGLKEEPFKNEYRVLVPSRKIVRQEEDPAMRAEEITTRVVESVEGRAFDFILANYANPDMIAHTGDYENCLKAVEIIDEQIGKIFKSCLEHDAVLIVTSDHGNLEKVLDPLTGQPQTRHDPNPVPIYIAAKEFRTEKTEAEIRGAEKTPIGILADVAPTILELMEIPKPKEMTGQSLLKFLL